MGKKKKALIILLVIIILGGGYFYLSRSKTKDVKQIDISSKKEAKSSGPLNTGSVSPISGLSCENYNRRPVAVMQPSDLQARPAAGFSEADMVIEMPAYTASVTRLMGVYICNIPKEMGAIRSSRHDYIALAKGLDAFFIHWGGSHFALDLLKENMIDHIDCMNTNYCARWSMTGKMRYEDTGHVTGENVLKAMKDMGLNMTSNFSGYPHQEESALDQRPNGGNLRVAFAKPFDVEYDYDKNTNSYLRTWAGVADTDRNNNQRIAPKNIAVIMAASEQITNTQDYTGKGLRDPWAGVEAIKNTGVQSISGRYNNVQIGDPWYDTSGSGDAYYYLNGKEYKGTWKKDRSKLDSKLYLYDESGSEMQFVPGQIWLEILEPGQSLRWTPAA
jgi:hypothetical protein